MVISILFVALACCRVRVGPTPELPAFFKFELLRRHVPRHCREVGVDQRVWVPLSTLASVATVLEASSYEHFPDSWVSPVVGVGLRPNLNVEIVVMAFQHRGHGPVLVPVQTHHVLSHLLECLIEGTLIVFTLALSVRDLASAVAAEDKDTPVVDSVELGDVRHTVRVHENKGELSGVEHLVIFHFEVALWTHTVVQLLPISGHLPFSLLLGTKIIDG